MEATTSFRNSKWIEFDVPDGADFCIYRNTDLANDERLYAKVFSLVETVQKLWYQIRAHIKLGMWLYKLKL